ncbi:sugar phosphate isomerase/epimerase family protein [Algisphaera agarilytica]|uniref:Sugar phosphate isomerase/epimerase n=1 Tax=Algisphaera agarilytica TaxID=1385975 RepID=A0A7X0HC67_9BACT|nr:sugar phosphate isomerase/epimerase [Algisphaera agarilytica]MBB6431680.1 sugar phosphate isomerase/epimerase [Algisphaera agarilytica]
MPRPVTLFTGQWADLPFETICAKASEFGYDGLELACWGDHFDVVQAAKSDKYCKQRWEVLEAYGLTSYSISMHLVGQAVCDLIDERHKSILPEDVWGDGEPEGVRKRAAANMKLAAKACRRFLNNKPGRGKKKGAAGDDFPGVVNGFTGSSIWHAIYAFPPTDQAFWEKGFKDFAKRFTPILNEFEKQDINFALEVHPTEIAFDTASAARAIDAVKGHKRFGFNYDPSHLGYQGVDYVGFIRKFADRIYHVHMKDAWWGHGDGTVGVFGGHTTFTDPRRFWDFRSLGHGDIDFEEIIVALNDIGYRGPLSVEWEDGRMDREYGATEAAEFVRSVDFPSSDIVFDAQFDN